MLCEEEEAADTFANDVLILVLMEDALRVLLHNQSRDNVLVLILVLMEDALRASDAKTGQVQSNKVLILVLMEDALRDITEPEFSSSGKS